MSIRPNPNLYPDGGYVFIEGDGTRFRSDSWKSLASAVREYRKRNGRPTGNPEDDVFAQYCARLPQHCNNAAPAPTTNAGHSMSLNQRVMQWFANMIQWRKKAAIPRVPDEEAARRAEICKKCPAYKSLVRSCEQCMNTVKHGRTILLDKAVSQHQDLLACEALGEDLPTSVHIQQPAVPVSRVPAGCWRK